MEVSFSRKETLKEKKRKRKSKEKPKETWVQTL